MTTLAVLRPRVPSAVKLRDQLVTLCRSCGAGVRLWGGALRPHNRGMRLCPGSWQAPASPVPAPDRLAGEG